MSARLNAAALNPAAQEFIPRTQRYIDTNPRTNPWSTPDNATRISRLLGERDFFYPRDTEPQHGLGYLPNISRKTSELQPYVSSIRHGIVRVRSLNIMGRKGSQGSDRGGLPAPTAPFPTQLGETSLRGMLHADSTSPYKSVEERNAKQQLALTHRTISAGMFFPDDKVCYFLPNLATKTTTLT